MNFENNQVSAADRIRTAFSAATIFVLFLTYYFVTSSYLPLGVGPDYVSHNDAVEFIYNNGRLATFPEDESDLSYTEYGGTRTLRPPLSYIVSAVFANLQRAEDDGLHRAFRMGPNLLLALTVTLAFYALYVYFGSYWIGVLGSLLIGLMPQYAFIASYNNDDSGAIFSATLMLTVLVLIFKRGVTLANVLLFGMAGGLVILSKQTAWLLLPTVLLFLLMFVRLGHKKLLRYGLLAIVVGTISGGWWLAFNVRHYGWNDPFLLKITKKVAEKHSNFPENKQFGYGVKGIGYADLLLKDHDDFWVKTAKSTVGNLDWLRLRVGTLQYGVYYTVLFIAFGYFFIRLILWSMGRVHRPVTLVVDNRVLALEALLVFAVVFQFYMYLWANINNDIQLQGKYLLPVFLAVLLLFFSALSNIAAHVTSRLSAPGASKIELSTRSTRNAVFALSAMFVVAVHADAMVNHVIPYYNPPVYETKLGDFQPVLVPDLAFRTRNDISEFYSTADGMDVRTTGEDPWFVIDIRSDELCGAFEGNILLRMLVESDHADVFKVFVDKGLGFRERDSYVRPINKGENELTYAIGISRCLELRLDPGTGVGRLLIKGMATAKIRIVRPD